MYRFCATCTCELAEYSDRLLGFTVEITLRTANRFQVIFGPIAGVPFLVDAPGPAVIENGGRVITPAFSHSATATRFFDTFQVGVNGTQMQFMPMPQTVPTVIPVGTPLRLDRPRFLPQKGHQTQTPTLSSEESFREPILAVEARGHDRFVLSSVPLPGYRMEGLAEGNRLVFVSNNDRFAVLCSSSVVATPGAWYVWIKREQVEAPTVDGATSPQESLRVFVP